MTALVPYDQRPYRLGTGIVLFDGRGQVFAARRIDTPEPAWQFPQGGIDEGEQPLEAARREMREEIGTDKAELLAESADWLAYDLPAELADRVWKGRYRGQKQKWFAFRFTGTDADIDIHGPHPEFSEWQWMPLAEVPRLIVAFKRPLYEAIVAEFAGIAAAMAGRG